MRSAQLKLETPIEPYTETVLAHGMMDGSKGDPISLHSEDTVRECVRHNISLSHPTVSHTLTFTEGPAELHGVTGFSLLPGSHLTVHTYSHPDKASVFCDSFGEHVFHSHFYNQIHNNLLRSNQSSFALVDRANNTVLQNTFVSHPSHTYGPHMTAVFDMQNNYVLDSSYFEHCLLSMIETISMTRLMGPFSVEDDRFLSSIIIIAESHLTFHLDKEQKLLYIDIFSCKEFSVRKAVRALISLLPGSLVFKNCIKRGNNFYAA